MSGRTILHLDLDAFYASVEEIDHPEFKNYPLVVGANPEQKRGVVSTCNYEARKYGIRSAMPISEAKKRCPHARFVPVRMSRYLEFSKKFFEILEHFSPDIEPLSVDEAFLDVTANLHYFRTDGVGLAKRIQQEVGTHGLSVSAGVASNKFVAKIASDLKKPQGLVECPPGDEIKFLQDLPIEKMWGVGPVTARYLKSCGVVRFRDFYETHRWKEKLKIREIDRLLMLAKGVDKRPVESHERKSLSVERTFIEDLTDDSEIRTVYLSIVEELVFRMLESGFRGRTLQIKIRYHDFTTLTRQIAFREAAISVQSIYTIVMKLFIENRKPGLPIRLLGAGFSNPIESELFSIQASEKDSLFFQLKKQYGSRISRASLLKKPK